MDHPIENITIMEFAHILLQKASLNLNNHFEDVMDHMMINDNNENLIPDDNMFPEELKASDKWQMEILDSAVNKENIEVFNESDASTQLCHNSIQVSICSTQISFVFLDEYFTIYIGFIREKV